MELEDISKAFEAVESVEQEAMIIWLSNYVKFAVYALKQSREI